MSLIRLTTAPIFSAASDRTWTVASVRVASSTARLATWADFADPLRSLGESLDLDVGAFCLRGRLARVDD